MTAPSPAPDLKALLLQARGRTAAWMFEVCAGPRPSVQQRQGLDSSGGRGGQRRG
jgi:hypothetical protein